MKKALDRSKTRLLAQLDALQTERLSEADALKDGLEMTVAMLESVRRVGAEVLNKGAPTDVVRLADDIHAQAKELFSAPPRVLRLPTVCFTPSDRLQKLMQLTASNLIGEVAEKDATTGS